MFARCVNGKLMWNETSNTFLSPTTGFHSSESDHTLTRVDGAVKDGWGGGQHQSVIGAGALVTGRWIIYGFFIDGMFWGILILVTWTW